MPASLRRALVALTVAVSTAAPAAAEPRPGCRPEDMRRAATGEPPDQECHVLRPAVMVAVRKPERDHPCPTNFLYTGNNGARYIGVEGYCVLQDDACLEVVILFLRICLGGDDPETDGPVVYPKGKGWPVLFDGKRVGEVRYAIYQSGYGGDPTSFALVELDPKVPATPVVRRWGAPSGVDRRITTTPETLFVTTPDVEQEMLATEGLYDPVRFGGVHPQPALGIGAPVLSADGKAVGLAVPASPAWGVERVDGLLARASARLKTKLRLLTVPRP